MTILADHEIRELCTTPTFVIKTNLPQPITNGKYIYPKEVESFTYASEDLLKEEIKNTVKDKASGALRDLFGKKKKE